MAGCFSDAPRENPFDSKDGFSITGQVLTSIGKNPISGALLSLTPSSAGTITDNNGFFAIQNIQPGSYTISCEAEGFAPAEKTVDLTNGISVEFELNALPQLASASLLTRHVSRFFPAEDEFYIDVELQGIDPDQTGGQLTGWYELQSFAFADTLSEDSLQSNLFLGRLEATDIGISSIRRLIGKPFTFFIEDSEGSVATSEDKFISRIIDTTPVTSRPIADDVVAIPFVMEWELVTQLVDFTYKIEIYEIQIDTTLLLVEIDGFRPGTTRYTYSTPIDPQLPEEKPLFWVLYIVDEFGNSSRSKPAAFSILQN